jgi:hypothetical protein
MPTPRVITHLLDKQRGRASKFKMWTACGEQVSTRLVYNLTTSVECKACLLAHALTELLKAGEHDGECDNGDGEFCVCSLHLAASDARKAAARTALDRVRGEQIQDAPK